MLTAKTAQRAFIQDNNQHFFGRTENIRWLVSKWIMDLVPITASNPKFIRRWNTEKGAYEYITVE